MHTLLRSTVLLAVVVVAHSATLSTPTAAQVARPDGSGLTAADSASVLLETALRFEREGRWDIAEAIYLHITERYGGTPAAADAAMRLTAPAADRAERISRVELQVFGTLYGMWLGVAVPLAFGADQPEAYGAGLLLGGPAGLFGSRAYLGAHPLTEGQARAISWGGVWGTWQGLGWAEVLEIGHDEVCDDFGCSPSDNQEELFASMIVGGLAGIVTGAVIARNPIRSGVSSGAQGGSIWGSIYGAMMAGILTDDSDAILVSSLLAGNAGLLAGGLIASHYDLSRSRVRMINLGALLGGVAGLGVDLLVQPEDEGVGLAIPLVTSLAGLAIAAHVTRGQDGGSEGPEEGATTLLRLDGGDLRFGTPIPVPTFLAVDDRAGRTQWRPGLTLDLFRATF